MSKHWDTNAIKNYKTVKQVKDELRRDNFNYLKEHPEIRAIVRFILHQAMNQLPENINEFAANLFDCGRDKLFPAAIAQQLKCVRSLLTKWGGFDCNLTLEPKKSSISLVSTDSIADGIENLLRYALIMPKDSDKCDFKINENGKLVKIANEAENEECEEPEEDPFENSEAANELHYINEDWTNKQN